MYFGIFLVKSSSSLSRVVYKLSSIIFKYRLESPVNCYLICSMFIISSLSCFLFMFIDWVIELSMILELHKVNRITPIIMQTILNTRSYVDAVDTSPYPTVVTVCTMNYNASAYTYVLSFNNLF